MFATSHHKSACDGISGTVKRLAVKACLMRQRCGQIVKAEEMLKGCVHYIFASLFLGLNMSIFQMKKNVF